MSKTILSTKKAYLIGVKSSIVVTIFSIFMLVLSLMGIEFENEYFKNLCFLGLIVEFIYGVIVSFYVLKKREKYLHLAPFLFLNWFIGCFSLNIFFNVFENLPIWVYVVTFLFCFTNFVIYSHHKSKCLTSSCYFFNGASFLLIIYYVIYLIPFMPYSFLGIFAVGMGFYGLVPVIVTICHVVVLIRKTTNSKQNQIAFTVGMVTVLIGFVIFAYQLHAESERIISKSATKSFDSNDDLPSYITISQSLKPNYFNEILLKRGIVYENTTNFLEFRSLNSFGNKQFNERKIHNPIVNLAYIFSDELDLSTDDRISILKSNFDKRLETEEQLWSGTDLVTKNIKEDVKVFPQERLAYTEITMDIACSKDSWGQKEAIYSFQLPEGSVATSLSLWVNGIERKGVLTTKEKAQKAYKQIVGVEARDPSLMQWREGNKVVVRVFPVSYELPRTFKCGFTTPLKTENDQLYYQSLNIKGPNISDAETLSRMQVVGNGKFESDKKFVLNNGFYTNISKGLEKWKASFAISKTDNFGSFVWKDKEYQVVPLQKELVSFVANEIILDLNSSWKKDEVASIVKNIAKKYYVYINLEKQEINTSNFENILPQFENLHYSLLPLYKLSQNSLVITKCGNFSANFEELESSKYLDKLKLNTKQKQIKVVNIGEEINPFWQTIKEQKYVEYVKLNLETALNMIKSNQFMMEREAENLVNIEPSNCAIQEITKTESSKNNGSNHIYRMYAFGKVLQEQVEIQADTLATNKYVDLAKDANIVTPITSLLVLETDADYDKHGIEKNVNTLGNASINNDGAVPEPHEWAMIIVAVIALYFYYKKIKNQIA